MDNPSHNMGRGRGQHQQYYRPGLTKKNYDPDRNNSRQFQSNDVENYSNATEPVSDQSDYRNRKLKKPEQQFYVPKAKQNNTKNTSMESLDSLPAQNFNVGRDINNDDSSNRNNDNKSNFKQNRNINNNNNNFRNKKPIRNDDQYTKNNNNNQQHQHQQFQNYREIRQVSEPRVTQGISYTGVNDRPRDCRSVEPNFIREKKPPSGRRNSITSEKGSFRLPSNIEQLPPRLQKKILAENGLPLTLLEDQMNSKKEEENYYSLGSQNNKFNYGNNQANWSQTLPMPPHSRGRGRGRIIDSRPETPVELSRPRSRSSGVDYDDFEYRPPSRNFQYDRYTHNTNEYRSRGGGNDFRSSNRSLTYDNHDNHHENNYESWNSNSNYQHHNNNNNKRQNYQNKPSDYQQNSNQNNRHNTNNNRQNYDNNYRQNRNPSKDYNSEHYNQSYKNDKRRNFYDHNNETDLRENFIRRKSPIHGHRSYDGQEKTQKQSISDRLINRNYEKTDQKTSQTAKAQQDSFGATGLSVPISVVPIVPVVDNPKEREKETEKILDWYEETEQSAIEENNSGGYNNSQSSQRRRRNRSHSNYKRDSEHSVTEEENLHNIKQEDVGQDYNKDGFKVPYQKTFNNQRPRRNSQNSNDDTSYDRYDFQQRRVSNSRNRKNSYTSVSRENSMDRRDNNLPRPNRSRRNSGRYSASRENSSERYTWNNQKKDASNVVRDPTNWRSDFSAERNNDPNTKSVIVNEDQNYGNGELNITNSKYLTSVQLEPFDAHKPYNTPGLLVLPTVSDNEIQKEEPLNTSTDSVSHKTLFDPKNPSKPILITATTSRNYVAPTDEKTSESTTHKNLIMTKASISDQYFPSRPIWYDRSSQHYQSAHKPQLITNLEKADMQMQLVIGSGELFREWENYMSLRTSIQSLMEQFLMSEMKFCQQENVEQHFWKLLYYNIIELLRKSLADDPDINNRTFYKSKLLEIIDSGTIYLDKLLLTLEKTYKFSLNDYLGHNSGTKGTNYIGLALVSAQKLFLFLGDLARYKEQINETNNYGRAKQWYVKAQQIVPKNGRPYNQLALLSVYSKRRIDAVYFYMRSLMSSNPFQSARESLIGLFDETRKKYENSQKKREEKNKARLKEKEHRFGGPLRRETWIHPESGRRIHRTSPLDPEATRNGDTSEEEELEQLDSFELNKRFIMSYMHVQGKLITKTGMESFNQCAIQMLREFRFLLRHSPIAMTQLRLLQLIALNMFAIDSTQLRDPNIAPGARSEVQESAISIALLMFGIILERFIIIVKETMSPGSSKIISNTPIITLGGESMMVATIATNHTNDNKIRRTKLNSVDEKLQETEISGKIKGQQQIIESGNCSGISGGGGINKDEQKKKLILPEDARVMLPAIKVWCDWLFCHSKVWNPPPSCSDYKLGMNSSHDPWIGLATLITILEKVDTNKNMLSIESRQDYDLVRLQEDITLAGFTPLMYNSPEPIYCHQDDDIELAQNSLRIQKLIFFCTNFLCTCDPPVLKKTIENDMNFIGFRSVVHNRTDESSDSELLVESFSDDDDVDDILNNDNKSELKSIENVTLRQNSNESNNESDNNLKNESAVEIRKLLRRKDELERRHKMQEKHNQRLQEILRLSTVSLHIEVRPRFLVPDTNCFVDFLDSIEAIAEAHPIYQLMIPLVVINELEGLSRGGKSADTLLSSSAPLAPKLDIFTSPNACKSDRFNDPDHETKVAEASKKALLFLKSRNPAVKCVTTKGSVLNTAQFTIEDDTSEQISNDDKILTTAINLCKVNLDKKSGETTCMFREVVLLTTDRNLRVKALSRDVPVRELPDFIKWAGLGS